MGFDDARNIVFCNEGLKESEAAFESSAFFLSTLALCKSIDPKIMPDTLNTEEVIPQAKSQPTVDWDSLISYWPVT